MTESRSRLPWRGAVASGAAATAALLATRADPGGFQATLALPAVLLALSAIAIHVRRLEVQLLTRALWCSTALVAAVSVTTPLLGVDRQLAFSILAATVVALVAAGRDGLRGDAAPGAFRPVAFRAPLLLAVGMALVDAHALLFSGLALLERFGIASPSLVLGPLLGVAAIGVYRLRTTAVLGLLLLNATVLAAAVSGALWGPPLFGVALAVSSVVQILLPLPMLRAILRRGAADARTGVRVASSARFAVDPAACDAGRDAEAEVEAAEAATASPANAWATPGES